MKFFDKKDKNIKYIMAVTLAVSFIILLYYVINHFGKFTSSIGNFIGIFISPLRPVIIGFAIAFFLYKPVDALHKYMLEKTKLKTGTARVLATLSILIISIMILGVFIAIIIPNTVESIASIINIIQGYAKDAPEYYSKIVNNPVLIKTLELFNVDLSDPEYINNVIATFLRGAQSWLEGLGSSLFNFVVATGSTIISIFLGICFSFYMLLEKETIKKQIGRFLESLLGVHYHKLHTLGSLMSFMFFKFLSGKGICSLIVGALCYILCIIFKIPYAGLITIVIAVTNMIPMFGPYIGGAIGVLFALLGGGIVEALILMGIVLVVQQVDANILAPKILGDVVGLNGFWIMFSIIFMGGIWGIWGMIFAIPVFAVLKILLAEWLYERDKKKKKKSAEKEELAAKKAEDSGEEISIKIKIENEMKNKDIKISLDTEKINKTGNV